jgi:hypothetical protein
MRITLIISLSIFFFFKSYSQNKLDTILTQKDDIYKIKLEMDGNMLDLNTLIRIFRNNQLILSDSVFSTSLYVEFKDMNSDGFNDILIYQSIGMRANVTYNLFLFQQYNNSFKRVVGFDEFPNLDTTKFKGILCSTILTGTVEYRFFKILNSGDIIDLNISEEDKFYNGKGYKKGLRKVKKLQKQLN